jgi:hypothetical protein
MKKVGVPLTPPRAPLHPDTGLYHFQTILWQHEAPLALGLANLDGKLGFNSIWHTIAAMFWFPGLGLAPVFGLNALIVVLVLFGLIQRIAADGSPSDVGFSRWYALLCLFAIAISASMTARAQTQSKPTQRSGRPTPQSEICFTDAVELARLIRSRTLSAVELMTASLAQIKRVNPKVNAIVTLVDDDMLLREARAADERLVRSGAIGPFHGFPHAVKDLVPTAGMRTQWRTTGRPRAISTPDSSTIPAATGRRRSPGAGCTSRPTRRV